MAHKCTKCGREFEDGSTEILKGCPSCGGKKFLYVRESERHRDVLLEKSPETLAKEAGQSVLEIKTPPIREVEVYDRVESIRILGPGSYELNIEKLAKSDEMVVGLGKEAKYVIDIPSMTKPMKKSRKGTSKRSPPK